VDVVRGRHARLQESSATCLLCQYVVGQERGAAQKADRLRCTVGVAMHDALLGPLCMGWHWVLDGLVSGHTDGWT